MHLHMCIWPTATAHLQPSTPSDITTWAPWPPQVRALRYHAMRLHILHLLRCQPVKTGQELRAVQRRCIASADTLRHRRGFDAYLQLDGGDHAPQGLICMQKSRHQANLDCPGVIARLLGTSEVGWAWHWLAELIPRSMVKVRQNKKCLAFDEVMFTWSCASVPSAMCGASSSLNIDT